MPKIAQIKEIDGHLWVRADIDNMENGSAWWSPKEQKEKYIEGWKDAIREQPFWINQIICKLGKKNP